MKEEQHIQDLFQTIRELPPEVELSAIEQFVMVQPVTAFNPPAGGNGGSSLLTSKNSIVMISSISIIGSAVLFFGGGSDKPSAATASRPDTPTPQQVLVQDSAPVLVDVAKADDVALARNPTLYPFTPNLDTAYPPTEVHYGVGVSPRYPQPVAPPAPAQKPQDPSECDDEHHTASTFAKELYSDGLIDLNEFSFSFNKNGLMVNGQRQPETVFAKYSTLFERQTGTAPDKGCHMDVFVSKGRCSASLSIDNDDDSKNTDLGAGKCETCSKKRELPPFTMVDLQSNGHLRIMAGTGYSIEMDTDDDNLFNQLKTEIKDDELIIRKEGKSKGLSMLTLTLPDNKLRRVNVSGSGNIELGSEFSGVELLNVDGSGNIHVEKILSTTELRAGVLGSGNVILTDVNAQRIVVSIPGSGSVSASGVSDDVKISIGGSGNADLVELHVKNATCDIDGSGSISVTADKEIKVSISGSGVVSYSGSPTVIQTITGSGVVEKRK